MFGQTMLMTGEMLKFVSLRSLQLSLPFVWALLNQEVLKTREMLKFEPPKAKEPAA